MEEYGLSYPLRLEISEHLRHNCIVRKYPDGSAHIIASERAIFREPGWEDVSFRKHRSTAEAAGEIPGGFDVTELSSYAIERIEEGERVRTAESLSRAQRRAKAAVRDLALSNDFTYFVTFTLNAEKIDRYDIRQITKKLNVWLDNRVRRDGLKYVLVPERHKDGAIHFHGLINNALPLVDSGTIDRGGGKPRKPRSAAQREKWLSEGGHIVYNAPAWDFGFSTAIKLYGERRAAVGYVCKYIAKQITPDGTPGKIGGRWYYSGGDLRRPEVVYCDVESSDFEALTGYEFVIPGLGAKCKTFETEGGGAK